MLIPLKMTDLCQDDQYAGMRSNVTMTTDNILSAFGSEGQNSLTAIVGLRRDAYRILVGKSEGKRPLGRPGRRWEDNIKWILKKWNGGMDWVDVVQNRECCNAD
jgi:hypothetical protein